LEKNRRFGKNRRLEKIEGLEKNIWKNRKVRKR